MAMQLLESPKYIKKKDLEENKFAFENYKYLRSAENPRSAYPNTAGSINHTFQDETGQKWVISGDTVMNRIVEEEFIKGMPCGLFYLGKKDNDGNDVKYHNWTAAIDVELQDELRSASQHLAEAIAPTDLNDLA